MKKTFNFMNNNRRRTEASLYSCKTCVWLKYPNSFNLLNLLGVSLIEQNKLAEAKTNYIELIKTNPSFAEAHNNLANIYIKENKIEEAIFYLEKAIANKHDLTQAHLNLAKIYIALGNSLQIKGDIEASVKNYKKAISHNNTR